MRVIGLAAFAACLVAPAWALDAIDWFTIDGGGVMGASGASYTMGGTIGQPDAGSLGGGVYSLSGGFWVGTIAVVGIWDGNGETVETPASFRLHAATPNPLVRRSVIAFDLPQAQFVRVHLYDAAGRLVRTLAEGRFPAGRHQRVWDGTDEGDRPVGAGIYLVRLDAETDRAWRKVIVLR